MVICCGFTVAILIFVAVFSFSISAPMYVCEVEFCTLKDVSIPTRENCDRQCHVCTSRHKNPLESSQCDMECRMRECPPPGLKQDTPCPQDLIKECYPDECNRKPGESHRTLHWDSLGAYCGPDCRIERCEKVKVPRQAQNCNGTDARRMECKRCEVGFTPSSDMQGPFCATDCSQRTEHCIYAPA